MTETTKQDHILSNQAYDTLKFVAQILLPALGTLYFALAAIWNLPAAEQVVGTIVAVDAFLGVFLGYSTKAYDDNPGKYGGTINITEFPDAEGLTNQTMVVDFHEDPEDVAQKKEITFRVNPPK